MLTAILFIACEPPDVVDADRDGVRAPQDCDDDDPAVSPALVERPDDGLDNDCDPDTPDDDIDGDGVPNAEDCAPANPDRYPGNEEIPYNGIDDDCDPGTPDDDLDGDRHPMAEDCDDGDPGRWWAGTVTGDVFAPDVPSLCAESCWVRIDGGLLLNRIRPATVGAAACLTGVSGELAITRSGEIADVDGLAGLRELGGLRIEWTSIVSLAGLAAVPALAGDLMLSRNPRLVDLGGLRGLTELGDSLVLTENGRLQDLSGLAGLTHVGGAVTVTDNPSLCTTHAEALIERIGRENITGEVVIEGNDDC